MIQFSLSPQTKQTVISFIGEFEEGTKTAQYFMIIERCQISTQIFKTLDMNRIFYKFNIILINKRRMT